MKADQKTQVEVTQAFKAMFEAYKKKDFQTILTCWSPDLDLVAIGVCDDKKAVGPEQLAENLTYEWAKYDVSSIGVKNFLVSAAGLIAWVCADIYLQGKRFEGDFELHTRLTGVMEKRNGRWLWVQMHMSRI